MNNILMMKINIKIKKIKREKWLNIPNHKTDIKYKTKKKKKSVNKSQIKILSQAAPIFFQQL